MCYSVFYLIFLFFIMSIFIANCMETNEGPFNPQSKRDLLQIINHPLPQN